MSTSKRSLPRAGCEILSFAHYRWNWAPHKRSGVISPQTPSRPLRWWRVWYYFPPLLGEGGGERVPYNGMNERYRSLRVQAVERDANGHVVYAIVQSSGLPARPLSR